MSETIPENTSAVWVSDGPFKMSSERAREQSWINTGGQTGVVGPDSLEVRAQPTPDGSVRIFPGAFAAEASPGGTSGYTTAPWQSYGRGIPTTTDVAISPTDSSGSRTDVVGIEVVDPVYEGTVDSVDWETHLFWRVRVIENANPDATVVAHFPSIPRPFVPLARINIPASTSTIYDEDIDDLRFLAVERSKPDSITQRPDTSYTLNAGDGRNLAVMRAATVPQWATHVQIDGEITGARCWGEGNASGDTRIVARRKDTGGANPETDLIIWSAPGNGTVFELPVSGRIPIYASMRGRPLECWFRLNHNQGDQELELQASNSALRVRFTFEELPTRR